jgi:MFS family permease
MIGAPVSYAFVADLAPEHLRGRYQGLYGLSWATGTVTGPVIGVWLFAQSPTALWIACGVVGGASALLALAARPWARPPARGASPREMEPVAAQVPGR